ncbi:3'-5' exonuclease [Modestobacter roseus]|uniref:3'-5' exonuclease n=1 Tax=Modestobacter roseus TaxID=1181884 RepID=UPI0012967C62|nr:3'-5' exonuclease [Modestobacter roseus]MQA35808.1 AAA family ATPase [Modestobacter roseus]
MPLPVPEGRQSDVVYLPAEGHQVVLGTAGTGKTVMAIHRAAHLADPATQNNGPTLLLTHNNALVHYLRHIAAEHADRIQIEVYGRFARGYLSSLDLMPRYGGIAEGYQRDGLIAQAIADIRKRFKPNAYFDRPAAFFSDELEWIDGQGITRLDNYLAAERIGRMAPLQPGQRRATWLIRERYIELRNSGGRPYDWSGLPLQVRKQLRVDARPRVYRHVVVDEAQDLSPEAIRSLVEAVQPGGSLTLFGDYAQQIYGQRVSWKSVGLSISTPELFTDNYRNTRQIADLALAMTEMPHFKDSPDLFAPKSPAVDGALPTLVHCDSSRAEYELARRSATNAGRYARVGVFARTRAQVKALADAIPGSTQLRKDMSRWTDDPGVYVGTYHSAKGLEFEVVILPYCGASNFPERDAIAAYGQQDAESRDARLLYVGVTRARTELLVTYSGQLTSLLPDPASGLWTVDRP